MPANSVSWVKLGRGFRGSSQIVTSRPFDDLERKLPARQRPYGRATAGSRARGEERERRDREGKESGAGAALRPETRPERTRVPRDGGPQGWTPDCSLPSQAAGGRRRTTRQAPFPFRPLPIPGKVRERCRTVQGRRPGLRSANDRSPPDMGCWTLGRRAGGNGQRVYRDPINYQRTTDRARRKARNSVPGPWPPGSPQLAPSGGMARKQSSPQLQWPSPVSADATAGLQDVGRRRTAVEWEDWLPWSSGTGASALAGLVWLASPCKWHLPSAADRLAAARSNLAGKMGSPMQNRSPGPLPASNGTGPNAGERQARRIGCSLNARLPFS